MSGSSTDDNPPARPRPRNARGGGGESEGSEDEVTERGSEVCQIGDDMCTVPSQLFDLPSLKGVLSLNTWNYCLTGSQFRSTHCNLVFCWLCIPHEIPSDFCAFLSLEVF
jgi:nuclear factor related to kappa-B-binding protein